MGWLMFPLQEQYCASLPKLISWTKTVIPGNFIWWLKGRDAFRWTVKKKNTLKPVICWFFRLTAIGISVFKLNPDFLKLLNFEVADSPGIRHLCIRDVRTADVFRIANPSLLEEEYHKAINYLEHQDGNDDIHYLVTCCAFTFLYKVQQLCFMENRHDSFSNIYLDINQFPEQNYSISALADQFHMSVRTFQRKFKRDMGCSMQSLVTTCRIGLARKLLQTTTLHFHD